MNMAIQSLPSVSQAMAQSANPKPVFPVSGTTAKVSPADIDWAEKLDKKMQLGYIPNQSDQIRYNHIIQNLQQIREGGGYVYEDTTFFSNNPRGIASIGSIIGRTLSGGYIGYRYSGEIANITHNTYQGIHDGIVGGHFGDAAKSLAVGLKDGGVIALKAGSISSAINAGTSIVANTFETLSGRQTGTEAIGNVAGDTVGGFLSGVGATVFSGLSTLGLSVAGVAGLPLVVAGVAGGAVGSVLLDMAYKGSGLFSVIKGRTMQMLKGSNTQSSTVQTPPATPQTASQTVGNSSPAFNSYPVSSPLAVSLNGSGTSSPYGLLPPEKLASGSDLHSFGLLNQAAA